MCLFHDGVTISPRSQSGCKSEIRVVRWKAYVVGLKFRRRIFPATIIFMKERDPVRRDFAFFFSKKEEELR